MSRGWESAIQEAILEDQRAFVPLALSESGNAIVASVPKQNGKPAQVILFHLGTKQYEVIQSLPEGFQSIGADLNERWVVWSEMDNEEFQDWKLHVYDRQLKVDKVVRKSEKKYPMLLLMPSLYQNDVVYGKGISEPTSKGPSIVVTKYNLISGEETHVADMGGNPLITKNYIIGTDAMIVKQLGKYFGIKTERISKSPKENKFSTFPPMEPPLLGLAARRVKVNLHSMVTSLGR